MMLKINDWSYELDRLRMHLRLLGTEDWSNINKYFIISTGRTGTKFLAKFFNQIDNVLATHEPNPDFLNLAINYARNKIDKRTVTNKLELYRRPLARKVNREGKDIYVESNNRLFSLIEPLSTVYNNFKIIHIIRDGRDYVRSGMSRDWYTQNDCEPRLKANMFKDDPYFDLWDKMSRFEKICWRWQKKDNFIYEDLKNIDNYIRVKFEDIFNNEEHSGLFRIADYIGVSREETKKIIEKMISKKINKNNSYELSKWPQWSKDKKENFKEIAGNHMNNYYNFE